MATVSLKDILAANMLVYVGRRTFRQRTDEVKWDKDEDRIAKAPEQFPHTFVDFSNVSVKDVAEHAGGKQGVVVDTQKAVDKATLNEVKAWRKAFIPEEIGQVLKNTVNLTPAERQKILQDSKTPYVVISFATSGTKLDVPKQPQDILDAIKEEAPELFEAALAPLDHAAQLEMAPIMYGRLQRAMAKLG